MKSDFQKQIKKEGRFAAFCEYNVFTGGEKLDATDLHQIPTSFIIYTTKRRTLNPAKETPPGRASGTEEKTIPTWLKKIEVYKTQWQV